MQSHSVPSNTMCGASAVKQSAVGSAINRIHSVMARISDSLDYTEQALSPALRQSEPPAVNPKQAHEIESELHRELLAIEARAEAFLNALDNIRARSTI